MTKQDTMQFIARIRAIFPASYARMDKSELQKVVSSWYSLYKDFPNEIVLKALEIYAMENNTPFGPAPGQLHAIIRDQLTPKREALENKYEAWDTVVGLLGSKELHYEPDKAYNSLSETSKKAVGNVRTLVQWSLMDYGQLEYVKNNFLDRYEELYEAEQERRSLPAYTLQSLKLGKPEQKQLSL